MTARRAVASCTGPVAAAAVLAGVVLAQAMPALPTRGVAACAGSVALMLAALPTRARPLALLLAGYAWALLHALGAMEARLPHAHDGRDRRVAVEVLDLPRAERDHVRFDARRLDDGTRLKLSWYGAAEPPRAGEQLTLLARLRRPRGVVNAGGFDFERHAAERRIAAVGSVRAVLARCDPLDAQAGRSAVAGTAQADFVSAPARHETCTAGLASIARARIDRSRDRYARAVDRRARAPGEADDSRRAAFALVRALAVGDTRALAPRDWRLLRATGTTHLVAISGLHVGLVASLGVLLARVGYAALPGLALRLVRARVEAALAFAAAAGYALVAGASLPVLRTLLMIAVVGAARCLARATDAPRSLALAAGVLVVADPLAVLAPGFWLSFAGVAWLAYCLGGRRPIGLAAAFLRAQGAASLALLPLTLWFFGQTTVVGPLANLVAVPWISFVCVPLALVAYASHALGIERATSFAIDLAGAASRPIVIVLERLAALPHAELHAALPNAAALALATVAVLWLLAPAGVPARALGLALIVPVAWPATPRLAPGEVAVDVLDVGQGLAVLVRTAQHALLYDAGPANGEYDAGDAIVVPALHALGVRRLDALVVSHPDGDHAGGADAVIAAFAPRAIFRGSDRRDRGCVAGEAAASDGSAQVTTHRGGRLPVLAGEVERRVDPGWRWDAVTFRWLHPPQHFPALGNDASCVLSIAVGAQRVLLPGDVGAVVEQRLVAAGLAPHALVLAPHHGSATSSSDAFVAAAAPTAVAYARGWRHRHGHPASRIVRRYAAVGATRHDTAVHGQLTFRLDRARGLTVATHARHADPRWWREPAVVE